MADDWRTEADEAWLARHRSDNFGRMRRRRTRVRVLGDAVSHAELGPFGGAPRNPQLKVASKEYSSVRYTEQRMTYTMIHVEVQRCRRCGRRLFEVHRPLFQSGNGTRLAIGAVRMCRRCGATSWLFYSRMPSTVRARVRARKVVL